MSKMVPLELSLLNEGQFKDEMAKAFTKLQQDALTYTKRYPDNAKGQKSKLTIAIELKCEDPKTEYYSITTNVKVVTPQPPAMVTAGIGDCTQTGELALFVRQEGSSYDDPTQHQTPLLEG